MKRFLNNMWEQASGKLYHSVYQIVIKSILISVMYFFIYSCNENPTINPPCEICPPEFRLTDFEPTWSPDGNTIAYIHGDTTSNLSGIYFINPDGSNNRLFSLV